MKNNSLLPQALSAIITATMVSQIIKSDNTKLYQCNECGFKYADKTITLKCEEWCKEHHSCNLEIIEHAVRKEDKS